jgi:dihydroflavonol-4-reductase
MHIFVTGGSGFIGSHVVDLLLDDGHSVSVLCRKPELTNAWKGKDVAMVPGDLAEPDSVLSALDGADIVFHIGEIRNTSSAAARKNVELVRKMSSEAEAKGVKRFVFISSITVAGIPSAVPATEETESAFVLRDLYTEYKREAEAIIRETLRSSEHAIVRPGIVYGPRSRHLGAMVKAVARLGPIGIPFVGLGRNRAPFVEVRDLARAIVLTGTCAEAANQTFNITDERPHSWLEFFSSLGGAQGRTVRLAPLPTFLLRFPAVLADLFANVMGFDLDLQTYITFASRDIAFDMGKAKKLLSWEQKHGDLDEAVREMVESYREGAG